MGGSTWNTNAARVRPVTTHLVRAVRTGAGARGLLEAGVRGARKGPRDVHRVRRRPRVAGSGLRRGVRGRRARRQPRAVRHSGPRDSARRRSVPRGSGPRGKTPYGALAPRMLVAVPARRVPPAPQELLPRAPRSQRAAAEACARQERAVRQRRGARPRGQTAPRAARVRGRRHVPPVLLLVARVGTHPLRAGDRRGARAAFPPVSGSRCSTWRSVRLRPCSAWCCCL